MTVTRQDVADALEEPDALATLARLYPEAGVATGPGWHLWLRTNAGWRKLLAPIRTAFWCDTTGGCGFVAKIILNSGEFVGHDGQRHPVAGKNYSLRPG